MLIRLHWQMTEARTRGAADWAARKGVLGLGPAVSDAGKEVATPRLVPGLSVWDVGWDE